MESGPAKQCPIARALDIVGDRWSLLMLRDFARFGPRKFQDLQKSLTGIGPSTLSDRLKSLVEHGILERRFYEEHPPRADYTLTEKGRRLMPVLKALKEWGEEFTP